MKPFYQGKIDTFCAMYAVLNALRITHGIRTLKAREIFNDTLMELAAHPEALAAVLEQTTDYIALIDHMLENCSKIMPLQIVYPFKKGEDVSVERFWETCQAWVNKEKNRTVIFRFMRFFDPLKDPVVRHWTTIATIDDAILHLYDSSHDAESIQNLTKTSFVTDRKNVTKETTIYVQADTVRCIRLPF